MTELLKRETFTTHRALEFFSEKELSMQIGHSKELWPIALVKELIDNSLDACETAGILPEIEVTVNDDAVSIKDNGPGLPEETLKRSLDYMIRVSDKNHYVSPSRGQLVSELLTGDVSNGNRQRVIDRLNQGKIRVLIATGQLIGEGFDCKKLSILFLATPIRFDGRVIQYLGRVLRPAPGKDKAKIYDYQDVHIPVLVASARARERVFESINKPI